MDYKLFSLTHHELFKNIISSNVKIKKNLIQMKQFFLLAFILKIRKKSKGHQVRPIQLILILNLTILNSSLIDLYALFFNRLSQFLS